MNRAERRRQEKKQNKSEKVFNVTRSQLIKMLENERDRISKDSTEQAFQLMMVFATFTFHDHARELVDDEEGESKFAKYCFELFEDFSKGLFTLDDIKGQLKEETGVEINF